MPESHANAIRKQHARRPGQAWPLRYARSYPGRPDQVRQVRAYLRQILAGWPRLDDAVAVASELATNSVLHSRSGLPGGVFTVRTEVHRGTGTCIAVLDEGGTWDFQPGDVRPEHGLDVVDALAGPGNWGVGGDAAGRIVWARLLWPAAALPPSPPIGPAAAPGPPSTPQPHPRPGQCHIDRIRTPAMSHRPGWGAARGAGPALPAAAIEPGTAPDVPPAVKSRPGQCHTGRIRTPAMSHRPGRGWNSGQGAAAGDVLADLCKLATELAAHGVPAHLVVPGRNRSPHLVLGTAEAGRAERIYAQADWFFWPTMERIAARDDVQTAAVRISRASDGRSGALDV